MPAWLRPKPDDQQVEEVEVADGALLQAARHDHHSFNLLYQRYLTPIYGYCYVRLGSKEAAEDATSETFLKALAGLDSYQGGKVAAWLFRIAHNIVVDSYRKRRPQGSLTEAAALSDPTPTPEERMMAKVERAEVQAAIGMLKEEQRTVLELYFSGWTGEQIAAVLGRSAGAVRMLHLRAVERVRQIILDNARGEGRQR